MFKNLSYHTESDEFCLSLHHDAQNDRYIMPSLYKPGNEDEVVGEASWLFTDLYPALKAYIHGIKDINSINQAITDWHTFVHEHDILDQFSNLSSQGFEDEEVLADLLECFEAVYADVTKYNLKLD